MKTCTLCQKQKTLDSFYYRNDHRRYRPECKQCFLARAARRRLLPEVQAANKAWSVEYHEKNRDRINERQLARYYQRRGLLDKIKLDSGCIDCGFDSHPAALQFDHRDPATKLFVVARKFHSIPWQRVLDEIAKCDVRCANCHAVRTVEEGHSSHLKAVA